MVSPSHWCYWCYLLQSLEEDVVPWKLTFESQPRSPTALCICVLCELEPLSNHEEQLSCPASWCTHGSAAVSSLLWHQMAVSIPRSAAISLFRPLPIFTLLTVKQCQKGWHHEHTRYFVALCCTFQCFMKRRVGGSSEMGPNIPRVAPDQGRSCVFCTCASDEGDSWLVGSSSGCDQKTLYFINFNVATVKGDGTRISVPTS